MCVCVCIYICVCVQKPVKSQFNIGYGLESENL